MENQYRIHKKGDDYFPQVRIKRWLFWGSWKKIAVFTHGFGEAELPDTSYPKTKIECEVIIQNYDLWFLKKYLPTSSYFNFNPTIK